MVRLHANIFHVLKLEITMFIKSYWIFIIFDKIIYLYQVLLRFFLWKNDVFKAFNNENISIILLETLNQMKY